MDDVIARLNAALEGRYRLLEEVGRGGMALVYLAEDLKHHRRVALKVLRAELAAVIGAERFLKEIEVTANLQHPNILPLYDSGEADGCLYYVMPLVEGETLRHRLDREHQLPCEEAVEIARGMAAALDHAHRHDVIHRDIKPSNVLLQEGQALVADFGIARAMRRAGGEERLTETGLSVGTPHYMSPEQAAGDREIDARSDIYSLGATTYEMLVGEPPHVGKTPQAVVARILSDTPAPVRRSRDLVPPNVEAAVAKALARSPADRFASAADFAAALTNPGFTVAGLPGAAAAPADPTPLQRAAPALAAGALLALALAAWGWLRPEPAPAVARYPLAFLPGQDLVDNTGLTFDISRGGRVLVYVGPGPEDPQLWVKWRDRAGAVPLPGTVGATEPAISPDGTEVLFRQGGRLAKAPLEGGAPVTVAEAVFAAGGGGAWLDDGSILYAMERPVRLARVPPGGGEPVLVGPAEVPRNMGTVLPAGLPGSKGALTTVCTVNCATMEVWVVDLEKGQGRVLVPGALRAWYVETGHVVYLRADGALFALPFDVERLEATGIAVPLSEHVKVDGLAADMALAPDGTLLYMSGEGAAATSLGLLEVVRVTRDGAARPVDPSWAMSPSRNSGLALSPDGTRLAIGLAGPEGDDVWIKELDDGPLLRLTSDTAEDTRPQWTPDGRGVYFISRRRENRAELWVARADGTGEPEPVLVDMERQIWDIDGTSDGTWLVGRVGGVQAEVGGRDIVAWRTDGDTDEVPLLASEYDEVAPRLSPDGRWLAYASQESGEWQVNVRPFPDVNAERTVVSRGPAASPLWSRDGRELFYLAYDREGRYTMMAAAVETGGGFRVTGRTALFPLPEGFVVSNLTTAYDVGSDGRFVMARTRVATDTQSPAPLVLVENWAEEIKARTGERR